MPKDPVSPKGVLQFKISRPKQLFKVCLVSWPKELFKYCVGLSNYLNIA